MTLNARELAILSTKSMRLSVKESLACLEEQGYKMTDPTYHRILKNISFKSKETAFGIAKNFLEHHVDMVHEMINIKKLMYQEYYEEKDHFKKANILSKITEQNTYISAYSEDTKYIIEEVAKKLRHEKKTDSVSTSSS